MVVRSADSILGAKQEILEIEAADADEAIGLAQSYCTEFVNETFRSATLIEPSGEIIWQTPV